MKRKILPTLLALMTLSISGCGNNDMMVLTPYGNAIIQDSEGNSSNTTSVANTRSEDTSSSDSSNTSDSSTDSSPDNSSTASSDLISVGFAQVGSESDWRLAQTQSMKSTFSEENGYSLTFVDCNQEQQNQISAIKDFISAKVDYIVLDPVVEDGYEDVLTEAKNANIPVIVVDRNISVDPSLYTCWVGSNFEQEGIDAGKWLENYLDSNNQSSETINMLTILGSDGASATNGRKDGMDKLLKEHSNWNMLDEQSGDFTEEGGYAVMSAYLKQYDDIDVVICQNDNEAYGAISAITEAGRSCGPNGDITIISFDATNGGFQAMIDGSINVDVECNPLEGPLVAELIQKLEANETVDPIQYVEEGVYPAETAAELISSRAY